jgi:hypothetical protein
VRPSRDDLIALIEAQAAQIASLVEAQARQIATLIARITELEARLANPAKTPDNSSLGSGPDYAHQRMIDAKMTVARKFLASLSYLVAIRRQSLRCENARSMMLRSL